MTLQESVNDRAKWLDSVKPGWHKLVPLEDGKIDMSGLCLNCAGCILDHVFEAENKANSIVYSGGYSFARDRYEVETAPLDWTMNPFASPEALPFWKQEISARLAVWTHKVEELVEA